MIEICLQAGRGFEGILMPLRGYLFGANNNSRFLFAPERATPRVKGSRLRGKAHVVCLCYKPVASMRQYSV